MGVHPRFDNSSVFLNELLILDVKFADSVPLLRPCTNLVQELNVGTVEHNFKAKNSLNRATVFICLFALACPDSQLV